MKEVGTFIRQVFSKISVCISTSKKNQKLNIVFGWNCEAKFLRTIDIIISKYELSEFEPDFTI